MYWGTVVAIQVVSSVFWFFQTYKAKHPWNAMTIVVIVIIAWATYTSLDMDILALRSYPRLIKLETCFNIDIVIGFIYPPKFLVLKITCRQLAFIKQQKMVTFRMAFKKPIFLNKIISYCIYRAFEIKLLQVMLFGSVKNFKNIFKFVKNSFFIKIGNSEKLICRKLKIKFPFLSFLQNF